MSTPTRGEGLTHAAGLHSAGQFAENSAHNLVHATTARKRDKYSCQSCEQRVVLKQGKVNLHHFAHSVHNVVKCSGYAGGETVEHLEAKWFLARHLDDFRFVMQLCGTCGARNTGSCVAFSTTAWNVVVEGKVPGTGSSRARRADVLLRLSTAAVTRRLKALYALEVRHSNPVSADKTRELRSVGCGVVEVSASAVLDCRQTEVPYYLANQHTDGLVPWTCHGCMQELAAARAARWVAYEEWYTAMWANMEVVEAQDEAVRAHERDAAQAERERRPKRKRLQCEAFSRLQLFRPTRFVKTQGKCTGRCPHCSDWMYHSHFHEFRHTDKVTSEESWWRDTVDSSDFLSRMWHVKRLVFCDNCVARCHSCTTPQPRAVLEQYGLCRLCNQDDTYFDSARKQRERMNMNT